MPTVIDSLVVKLGLDGSQFRVGRKEAETDLNAVKGAAIRTGQQLESSGKQAAEFFAAIKNEALGLIGTLLGATGLEAIVRKTTESMAQLGREAANLNMDPQQLAAMSMAFERFGASAETTRQTLFGISQAIENFKITGNPEILRFLQIVGGTPQNSPVEVLEKFVAYAQAHKNDAALVNFVGRGLGIDQATINASLQMKSVAQFRKEYNDALKDSPTQREVDQAQKLQKSWIELKQAATGLANSIVTEYGPAIQKVLEWGKEEIRQNPKVIEAITMATTALTALGAVRITANLLGLTGVAQVAAGIAATLGGILLSIAGIGAWYEALHINPLNEGERELLGPQKGTPLSWYVLQHPGAYVPSEGRVVPSVEPPRPGSSAHDVMEATRKFWLAKGFTPAQVAGFLAAGPGAESGFNPNAIGDNGTSFGLYQFHGDLWTQLVRRYGMHPTVEQQNEFAWELLNRPENRNLLFSLRAAPNEGVAASRFTKGFERPKNADAEAARRAASAPRFLPPPKPNDPSLLLRRQSPLPALIPPERVSLNVTGPITINTKATDGRALARDFTSAIVTQANRGLA